MAQAVLITQLFAPSQLTGSAATIYTVPATTGIVLINARLRFTNTSTTVIHQVTAYAIQSGGSAAASNQFLNAESIAPSQHLDVDVPLLTASGFIQAFADTTTVVTIFALSGTLITP